MTMMMRSAIPNRPAISDVLIKASANIAFRTKLLASPEDAIAGMNLSPEDVAVLAGVQAPTLSEYARQLKTRLMS